MASTTAETPTATLDPPNAWSGVVAALEQLPTDALALRGLPERDFLALNASYAQALRRDRCR
jgi:hypothetical protein